VNLPRNPDAVSDTLVTIRSARMGEKLRRLGRTFKDPNVKDHLFWSSSGRFSPFSIIGFAGEFKKDDAESNKKRLIMVLATAQSQRKALSLKKSIVMGATGCRGRVQIYSSYWEDDETVCTCYSSGAESSVLFTSSFMFTHTSQHSILQTLFRSYAYGSFSQSSRSTSRSRLSRSLANGLLRAKR
jgi:hypothetical protein